MSANQHRKTFVIKSPNSEPDLPLGDSTESTESKDVLPTVRRMHFEIKSVGAKYEMPQRLHVSPPIANDLTAIRDADLNQQFTLYFSRRSFEQIEEHIGWGRRTTNNGVEQGGILVGEVYQGSSDHNVYALVYDAIAGRKAQGTGAYLAMTHETWFEMLSQADEIIDGSSDSNRQIVGWYHTHPNMLDVFMSGTDRATQHTFFPNEWQFAVVLNPQRRIWRVYHGASSEQCRGFVMDAAAESETAPADSSGEENGLPSRLATRPVPFAEQMPLEDIHLRTTTAREKGRARWKQHTTITLAFYSLLVTAIASWLLIRSASMRRKSTQVVDPSVSSSLPATELSHERLERLQIVITEWKAQMLSREDYDRQLLNRLDKILDEISPPPIQPSTAGSIEANTTSRRDRLAAPTSIFPSPNPLPDWQPSANLDPPKQ